MRKKKNIIGPRVRKARNEAKPPITQEDLAARLQLKGIKIDQAMISRIEKGERLVTDYEVKAIAKALKVSAGWLIEGKTGIAHFESGTVAQFAAENTAEIEKPSGI
jgi:transcriptional regulator with XRE-family HTH domain